MLIFKLTKKRIFVFPRFKSFSEGLGEAMCGWQGDGVQHGRGLEEWQVMLYSFFSGNKISANRAFLALLHHYRPDLVDIKDMQECNAVENCTKAFSIAEVREGQQSSYTGIIFSSQISF